jgi:hypothetical protein
MLPGVGIGYVSPYANFAPALIFPYAAMGADNGKPRSRAYMPESKWVREEDQPAMTCALASCASGGLGDTESYSVQIVRSHIDNFPRCYV